MEEPRTICKTPLYYARVVATEAFITRNRLCLRTPHDILHRWLNMSDPLQFQEEVLELYLPWEVVVAEGRPDYIAKVESKVLEHRVITDIQETAQDFLDYMQVAWEKVLKKKFVESSQYVTKLGTWLWLMGRADLEKIILRKELYNPYGGPAVITVCKMMGIEYPGSLDIFSQIKPSYGY